MTTSEKREERKKRAQNRLLFDNLGKHGKLRRVVEVVEQAEKQKKNI